MLSYRHAFHAGNHADVLKHFVLFEVLSYYNRKDKPYTYVDTHAGAGRYNLLGGPSAQAREYEQGIGRLWGLTPGGPLAGFLEALHRLNPGERLRSYPGSPLLAQSLVRAADRLQLFEMHPADQAALRALFKGAGRQVQVRGEDGFAGLLAVLPPLSRRAVILIDPPYEVKADYRRVEEVLKGALKRFAQGTYLVWYPLLRRAEAQTLRERLCRAGAGAWLQVELQVQGQPAEGHGMYGSGMFVINPPWTLPQQLAAAMPLLRDALAQDPDAAFTLAHEIP